MHGLGNDFVMVKDSDLARAFAALKLESVDAAVALSLLARKICDRRFGIGGDGLIVAVSIKAPQAVVASLIAEYPAYKSCDLAWIYINSDGSSAEMCGNGLRCLAYYARLCGLDGGENQDNRSSWPQQNNFTIATSVYAVEVNIDLTGSDQAAPTDGGSRNRNRCTVRTSLAGPDFDGATAVGKFINGTIALSDITLSATAVRMGNPHCVIFDSPALNLGQYQGCMQGICDGDSSSFLEKFPQPLIDLAHQIQSHALFPQGVNVEFVLPQGRDRAVVYVVERGCGPTLACASGAGAVVAAGVIEERLNRQCCVILPGGELEVAWSSVNNHIELNGPAQLAFAGTFSVSRSIFLSSEFSSANVASLSERSSSAKEELRA